MGSTSEKNVHAYKVRHFCGMICAFHFCHATSSYYINPSVALMIEAITREREKFQKYFAARTLDDDDFPPDMFRYNFEQRKNCRMRCLIYKAKSTSAREPC